MMPGAASTNSRPEATAICEVAMLGRIGTMQHAVAEFGQVRDLFRTGFEERRARGWRQRMLGGEHIHHPLLANAAIAASRPQ